MARVFSGKVVIPGDKMEEYFKLLEEAERAREPFRKYLGGLNDEFERYLRRKYSSRTAKKHTSITFVFIEFLCRYTDVESIEEVTKGMANTHFHRWYKRKVLDFSSPDDLRVAVKKFFQFLADEKGIINEKVLKSFK